MDYEPSRRRRLLILISVCFSVFMATLDSSIVNIALPVISEKLGAPLSSAQWIVTSYLITISVLLLIWGGVADMAGKKAVFTAGFIIFTLGSLFCGLSRSLEALVASRVLQAVGASGMMSLSQGIITAAFPAGERGKALGITGGMVAIGNLLGPSLGGVLVHSMGWESIFFINIPVGVGATALSLAVIPRMRADAEGRKFDTPGTALFIPSVLLLFGGMLFLQEGILSPGAAAGMIALSAVGMAFFIRREARAENPLLTLSFFKIRLFTMGIISAFLAFVAIFATVLFMPFYLQAALGLDTLKAGLLMSANPMASFIVAPISGRLSDKYSYKVLTVAGLTICAASLFGIASFGTATPQWLIFALLALMGAGSAMFQSPNTSSVMGSVQRSRLGVAGGMQALSRNLGMVTGSSVSLLLFGLITKLNVNALSSDKGVDAGLFLRGFRGAIIFAALAALTGAAVCLMRAARPGYKGNAASE